MTTTQPTVQYWNGSAWTTMTHVRSISYTSGRQDEISGASAGQATFVLDNADSTFVGVGVNLLPKMTPIRVMVNGNTQARWSGWVDGSPVTFPSPEGTSSLLTVTASDSLALMQRHFCQTSIYEETLAAAVFTGSPTFAFTPSGCGYWPMSDPAGSSTAYEATGSGTWGVAAVSGPATFGLAGVNASQSMSADIASATAPPVTGGSVANGLTLGFWAYMPGLGQVPLINAEIDFGTAGFMRISNTGTSTAIHLSSSDGGSGGVPFTSAAVGGWAVGWNYIHATMTSGGILGLSVNGVFQATATPGTWAPGSTAIGTVQFGSTSPICHAWAALAPGPSAESLYSAATENLGGLTTTQFLSTLAYWAVPLAPFGANTIGQDNNGTLTPSAGVTFTGNDCLSLAQVAAETEDGPLFCARSGVIASWTHNSLTDFARNAATAAFVNGDVEGDLTLARDAQYLITNAQITALSGSGGVQSATKNLGLFGNYPLQKSLYVTDVQAVDFANWHVFIYGDINYGRVGHFTIDLLNSVDIQTAALAIDIGSRVTFTGLPAQGGYTTADVIVQGFTENWTIDGWTITFNTTPSSSYLCWVMEDPTYGLLDQTTVLGY